MIDLETMTEEEARGFFNKKTRKINIKQDIRCLCGRKVAEKKDKKTVVKCRSCKQKVEV
jgi:hypothetical protein